MRRFAIRFREILIERIDTQTPDRPDGRKRNIDDTGELRGRAAPPRVDWAAKMGFIQFRSFFQLLLRHGIAKKEGRKRQTDHNNNNNGQHLNNVEIWRQQYIVNVKTPS